MCRTTSEGGRVVFSFKPRDANTDPVTVTLAPEYEKVQGEKTQVNWTVAATQLLIASWVNRREQFTERSARQVYSLISSDLEEMGHHYTCEQCGVKWRSLKSSFLKVKSSGRGRPSTWTHYQAMADALEEEDTYADHHHTQEEVSAPEKADNCDTKDPSLLRNSPPHWFHPGDNNGKRKSAAPEPSPVVQIKACKVTSDWVKCFDEMKDEWTTRREERRRMHEERMELGRRKLQLMEELIKAIKSK
ncbi:hypothetical protein ACOMHN_002150 [Nucella lapillus]